MKKVHLARKELCALFITHFRHKCINWGRYNGIVRPGYNFFEETSERKNQVERIILGVCQISCSQPHTPLLRQHKRIQQQESPDFKRASGDNRHQKLHTPELLWIRQTWSRANELHWPCSQAGRWSTDSSYIHTNKHNLSLQLIFACLWSYIIELSTESGPGNPDIYSRNLPSCLEKL